MCKKDHIWNLAICSCKNREYLTSIIDDSVITGDQIIDVEAEVKSYDKEKKTILKNIISEYNLCCICESVNYEWIICFYILRAFLLITIALLIAASIY